ncbi:hypothetical protein GCM10009789_39280 [Kribbella sancticallisti]|uniref:Tachylectin 2 domain-containing protein n=1 Tax=Kribbella sancticallisti TaxID=460087 RepID=A0ABP4PMF9_9ACTN
MMKIVRSRAILTAVSAGLALLAGALVPITSATAGPAAAGPPGPNARLGTAYETVAENCGPLSTGALYGLRDNGELTWNQFTMSSDGSPTQWAAPKTIATGWTGLVHFFGDGRTIYTIDPAGNLRWYGYSAPGTGDGSWLPGSGTVIDEGWNTLVKIAYAGGGVFYGVDTSGNLRWYRHTGYFDGTPAWTPGSSKIIDDGWGDTHALAAAGTFIYAAPTSGILRWYRYDGAWTGEGSWAPNSGAMIDDGGWEQATSMRAYYQANFGPVIIRTLDAESTMRWYVHRGYNEGTAYWHPLSASIAAPVWPIPAASGSSASVDAQCAE